MLKTTKKYKYIIAGVFFISIRSLPPFDFLQNKIILNGEWYDQLWRKGGWFYKFQISEKRKKAVLSAWKIISAFTPNYHKKYVSKAYSIALPANRRPISKHVLCWSCGRLGVDIHRNGRFFYWGNFKSHPPKIKADALWQVWGVLKLPLLYGGRKTFYTFSRTSG